MERSVVGCPLSSFLLLQSDHKHVSAARHKLDRYVRTALCWMIVVISRAVIANTDFGVANLKKNAMRLVID
jgi:hypothetical protein